MAVELELEDDGQEGWMLEVMRKEEILARRKTRRMEWEAGYICKGIMKDIMESVSHRKLAGVGGGYYWLSRWPIGRENKIWTEIITGGAVDNQRN